MTRTNAARRPCKTGVLACSGPRHVGCDCPARRPIEMHVDLYIATVMKLATLLQLTAGIYAIRAPGVPMSVDKAAQYAVAATFHGTRAGIDPYELAAIARNESD